MLHPQSASTFRLRRGGLRSVDVHGWRAGTDLSWSAEPTQSGCGGDTPTGTHTYPEMRLPQSIWAGSL